MAPTRGRGEAPRAARLPERAGFDFEAGDFRRYGSARNLYNFHIGHAGSY